MKDRVKSILAEALLASVATAETEVQIPYLASRRRSPDFLISTSWRRASLALPASKTHHDSGVRYGGLKWRP